MIYKNIVTISFFLFINSAMMSLSGADESESFESIVEITVISTRNRLSFEQQPTRIELLGSEEVNEKANMKPGEIRMLLNEITGIHVQQTSPITFNSSIRIQGLDGKYTQLLLDGMPLYGGLSAGLGLLQIPPLDLEQVEVIKGANSTLYGGGAIAGLVNLITKKPKNESKTSVMLNKTSAGGMDVSSFHASEKSSVSSTIFVSYNKNNAYGPDESGFSAIPKFNRWTINPKLFIEASETELSFGFNAVGENRIGGNLNYISGNTNTPAYFEKIGTDRISTQFNYLKQLNSGKEFTARNSLNYTKQSISIPNYDFQGIQKSSFTELNFAGSQNQIDWIAGLNFWTDEFEKEIPVSDPPLNFSDSTFGIFTQGTLIIDNHWSIETGLRLDSTSEYGDFFLPRLSVLLTPNSHTSIRLGGGMGYKKPTLLSDDAQRLQYRDIIPIDNDHLKAEESFGLNLDFNRIFDLSNDATLNLNLLLFYTQVKDPIRLIASENAQYAFKQPDDYVDTKGSELNLIWRHNNFKYFLGYTYADVQIKNSIDTRHEPLMPKERVNNVFVYEVEGKLRIGLEAYYYGQQMRSDGTKTRDFWIFGLMMEKAHNEVLSYFLNFENFTDTRQSRYEDIYVGPGGNPSIVEIFAPLDGFVINGGLKINF